MDKGKLRLVALFVNLLFMFGVNAVLNEFGVPLCGVIAIGVLVMTVVEKILYRAYGITDDDDDDGGDDDDDDDDDDDGDGQPVNDWVYVKGRV